MAYIPVDWRNSLRKECRRRRHSERTAETYIHCIEKFFAYNNKTIDKASKKDVKEYLTQLSEKGLSGSTLNVNHMALRFLFQEVLNKKIRIDIKYSKTPKRLPEYLTKEEVKRLLGKITNWKHKLMIEMLYGSGIRVSELINMKIKDLVLNEGYGYVRNGKGGKDRIIVLPRIVTEKIKNLKEIEGLEEEDYLFISNRKKKYSVRSIQQIIKKAARKAGIKKRVHPHTMRHSYATHLIERNHGINEVQALLGHKSPETTMIYIHGNKGRMINIKSPLEE
ncbi:hypothetical protein COU61_01640 [Candidatus Pacearchaeota archaeon CG10_big_fil_rev_8_21_14_0_10_35_13]|nr:MAG: hypothetical protein COU61_01640 [Candidatus Pacearchaeota archaeon CG10_big_fil_rev_8_21_14_0_10_35_13]